ncbi:hypothetical protein HWV62_35350 [Athelia sp. TMB]|nr:hypothetical protein HWV62_30045 [Athelia sp. TMB]KAF7986350.1 hypothetical protein HWV62_35350 [Athelia sp. TMB]
MSANGQPSSSLERTDSMSPPPMSPSAALADTRLSFDADRPPALNGINGTNGKHSHSDSIGEDDAELDVVERLQRDLARTNEEKEQLATQYRTLLAKLTTMRTQLGNKLKQDAEELDRREQQIIQLEAQNEDLVSTVETLKSELISSSEEAARASQELDVMRSRALNDNAQEMLLKDRELRETHSELERCRMERDEWEQVAMREKMMVDEIRMTEESLRRELEFELEARQRESGQLEMEREQSRNLQSVLEDFQAAKDHELRQAVQGYKTQLDQVTILLAEYKHRALNAEVRLEDTTTDTSRTQELEKEVKEKNLLIGKLRHEAVIINEHLMEALRRLRRTSSDTNVDRRLVSNVLISFLSTPRADPKRFEMLQLLATVLAWGDSEREKAGLQRTQGAGTGAPLSFWSRGSPKGGKQELEKTDETESFSRLWVEFLLTEASAGGDAPPRRSNGSLPASPTQPLSPLGTGGKRLASFGAAAGRNALQTPLNLEPPQTRKGKEREVDS